MLQSKHFFQSPTFLKIVLLLVRAKRAQLAFAAVNDQYVESDLVFHNLFFWLYWQITVLNNAC